MDTAERIVVGGVAIVVVGAYLTCGALTAHLLGLGDSPFLWFAVTAGWPLVLMFLFTLAMIGVGIIARVIKLIAETTK